MSEKLGTFVEVLYPGSLFPEEEVKQVSERDPQAIAKKHPRAFCFQFFDQVSTEVIVDGKKRIVSGDRKNHSPKYFPGAMTLTADDLRKMDGDYRILISNMECNGWPKVVRCRTGNFQPFEKDCELLEATND